MNAAPPEPQSLWTNEDPRLHMRCWDGEGAPLLLAHGMAAHAGWWAEAAPELSRSFRPVAVDFHGHGDSAWLPGGDYGEAGFAADLEAARHALGWGRMVLAAHSLGARVALEYARRHPDRVLALIAVDFLPEVHEESSRGFEKARSRAQPRYPDEDSMLRRFRLQPPGTLLSAEALRGLGRQGVKRDAGGWTWKYDWRAFRARYDPVWPTLPEVRVPTLVVRGEHSTILTRPDLERVVAAIPGARGLEIPGAHHHVPLDAPSQLAREIARFVASLK